MHRVRGVADQCDLRSHVQRFQPLIQFRIRLQSGGQKDRVGRDQRLFLSLQNEDAVRRDPLSHGVGENVHSGNQCLLAQNQSDLRSDGARYLPLPAYQRDMMALACQDLPVVIGKSLVVI